jgi:hypothetical protein
MWPYRHQWCCRQPWAVHSSLHAKTRLYVGLRPRADGCPPAYLSSLSLPLSLPLSCSVDALSPACLRTPRPPCTINPPFIPRAWLQAAHPEPFITPEAAAANILAVGERVAVEDGEGGWGVAALNNEFMYCLKVLDKSRDLEAIALAYLQCAPKESTLG